MIFEPTFLTWYLVPIGSLGVSLGLIALAWSDVTRFEIDPYAIVLIVCSAAAIYLATGQSLAVPFATSALALMSFMVARFWSPKSIAEGDLGLIAGLGFLSGPLFAVFAVAFVVTSLVTAFAYSRARGKPALKSSFPMALPASIAAGFSFALQLMGDVV